MRSAKRRRCDRAEQAISRLPYRAEVMQEEFALFRLTGELPEDDDRLTGELLQRALRGGEAEDPAQMSELELLVICDATESYRPPEPTVRLRLFDEALCDDPFFRRAGRLAIEHLVLRDGDVCDPRFGAGLGLPTHGSVGMHVLGYPQRLAVAPYAEQAERLFRRMDELRAQMDYTQDGWWNPVRDALLAFLGDGVMPPDGVVGEWVLALVEYDCLWRHRCGEDVAALMARLDAAARAPGKGREEGLGRVQELLHDDARLR